MLVLTRRPGESIDVDGPARLTVLSSRRGALQIGVEAPKSTTVMRPDARKKTPRPDAALQPS